MLDADDLRWQALLIPASADAPADPSTPDALGLAMADVVRLEAALADCQASCESYRVLAQLALDRIASLTVHVEALTARLRGDR